MELHSKKEGVISTKRERENGKEKREKEGERGDFIGERGGRRAVTNGGCKAMSPLPTPSPNRKGRRDRIGCYGNF